jgi:hypothetical protein
MAFGDKEPFDYYLSGFLSAARSIDYRLRHEQKAVYPAWRKAWEGKLGTAEQGLMKFMADDRAVEVHQSGSGRSIKQERIEMQGNATYSDRSGTVTVSAVPRTLTPDKTGPDAVIAKPSYHFTIGGSERKATEACGEYLSLLERMVAAFKADHP